MVLQRGEDSGVGVRDQDAMRAEGGLRSKFTGFTEQGQGQLPAGAQERHGVMTIGAEGVRCVRALSVSGGSQPSSMPRFTDWRGD